MQQKFDVFVNFRGDDVRFNFLSHLIPALNQTSLEIFVDYRIKSGEKISQALISAIENSKLALAIFSPRYASSRWCLNELVEIIKCRDNPKINQILIPVFYHVASGDVKGQKRSFAESFKEHENSKYLENRKSVPIWKDALEKACEHKGISIKEKSSEYDAVFDIVNDVLIALGRPPVEKKDESFNSVKLIHTIELQVKGKIWTSSSSSSQGIHIENLDSLLNILKHQAPPSSSSSSSSSLPFELNHQTNSSYSQALTYGQSEESKSMGSSSPATEWNPQTNSTYDQDSNSRLSKGFKSTGTSSGTATERKPPANSSDTKASTYGQSEGSKNTRTSSGTAIEWKPRANYSDMKASTYGQSEGSKSTATSLVTLTELKPRGKSSYRKASIGGQSKGFHPTIADFYSPYAEGEVVLFVTSSSIIKETVEHCHEVIELLKSYGIFAEERDISKSKDEKELEEVFKENPGELPALFVDGYYFGGYEVIMELKESGKLEEVLEGYI